MKTTDDIRKSFLDFFENKEHTIVKSSSVVPVDDPTLLFTNAGMNQFKNVLLGLEKRDYVRAASVQKCIRAGGKHNDLENVGFTARHLTFFEMLGNWSFGDYYKKEAIKWAWEYVTEIVKLSENKLYVSIYKDDDESFEIWNKIIGIPAERIIRLGDIENGDEENFWSMGPTGPCGPCTEIHYDTGKPCSEKDEHCDPGCDCDRYLEIWNNVFMEFNRDESGNLTPLKMKSVDTGLGLERLASIIQNTETNFDIDIFKPIMDSISEITGKIYIENKNTFRVIADHIRCLTFSITDGAVPSNEGRGHVLRRILRRALRFGKKLDMNEPFLYKIVPSVIESLSNTYPEIKHKQDYVQKVIKSEEISFLKTLDRGIEIFNQIAEECKNNNKTVINGRDAFVLYDTYGFPLDLTQLMAKEIALKVDTDDFDVHMNKQVKQSKEASKFGVNYNFDNTSFERLEKQQSEFIGYHTHNTKTKIIEYKQTDNKIEVVLKETPFYGESGGQIGDTGKIYNSSFELSVINTVKINNKNVCVCELKKGSLDDIIKNNTVNCEINVGKRLAIQKNHTATHLLHKALKTVIGEHAEQSGSYVADDRFRFDFTHFEKITDSDIKEIETIVNTVIQENIELQFIKTTIDQAKKMGAVALFNEKYGDIVRVVKTGDFSIELCGGTHVSQLGEIGIFKILHETAVASGIRRIEAVTGIEALKYFFNIENTINHITDYLNTDIDFCLNKIEKLQNENLNLIKENEKLKQKTASSDIKSHFDKIEKINGIEFLFLKLKDYDNQQIKIIVDEFKKVKLNGIIIVCNIVNNKKCIINVGVGNTASKKYKAGDLIKKITSVTGGGGGGNPQFAQGSVANFNKLDEAIEKLKNIF